MESAHEIADEVVAMLNGLDTSIQFKAENPAGVPEIDRAVKSASVQCYAFGETEVPVDRGGGRSSERVVCLLINVPLDGQTTKAKCLKWLNELKDGFLGFVTPSGWRWEGGLSDPLYDFDALAQKSQFRSVYKANFEKIA